MRASAGYGVLIAIAAALGACAPSRPAPIKPRPVAAVDQVRLADAVSDPSQWLTVGGTYQEQRYSPLDTITDANVGRLRLVWSHDLDTARGQEATPLVVDGVERQHLGPSRGGVHDAVDHQGRGLLAAGGVEVVAPD